LNVERTILIVLLILIAYGLFFRQPVVNVTVPSPEVNVEPSETKVVVKENPELVSGLFSLIDVVRGGICDVNFECKPVFYGRNNNIQPAHTNVQWTLRGGDLIVKNVATIANTYGYSMQPTIFSGNKLILYDYHDRSQLKEGMIIFYVSNGKNRVHRIKGLYEDFLVVQGDNLLEEEKIKYDQIKYVVVGVLYE